MSHVVKGILRGKRLGTVYGNKSARDFRGNSGNGSIDRGNPEWTHTPSDSSSHPMPTPAPKPWTNKDTGRVPDYINEGWDCD